MKIIQYTILPTYLYVFFVRTELHISFYSNVIFLGIVFTQKSRSIFYTFRLFFTRVLHKKPYP